MRLATIECIELFSALRISIKPMWIVRIALSHPYTFVVLAILLLIVGPITILRTPTDILPSIDIPVVSVVWSYTDLPPEEMADRITSIFERSLTTTVNNIQHIESYSLLGMSVTKVFFQPSANIAVALSQVTAIAQTILKTLPPGTTPPLILSYDASTVPILELLLSSNTLSEVALNDLGNNFIRPQLAVVQGASLPVPYGGKTRQVQIDLNQKAMQAYGVSAADINASVGMQNLILPAGTQKIGQTEYIIKLNSSPIKLDQINQFPIQGNPKNVLYLRDVAHAYNGSPPQTNIVLMNGRRAVMMSIQKTGNASTLDVIKRVKRRLPFIKAGMPPGLSVSLFGDQSIFVADAIRGVITEGISAACLAGLMILLFIGSWRSTLIITVSIPLSVLTALIVLSALGQTINIMTLGGLALAVGILVDDATVAIENINWHLEHGKEVEAAILDGAYQIAIPALVSTLCICIVFVPMFMLEGVARFLFIPLAEAVVFSMLASYFFSRTLIPTLAKYLLHKHKPDQSLPRVIILFETIFSRLRERYRHNLSLLLEHRKIFAILFLLFLLISLLILFPLLGSDFFPKVDGGQIKIHMRGPTGLRVEETANLCGQVSSLIKQIIPPTELDTIVDNIGVPVSGINLSYSNSGTIGPEDADILISLKADHQSSMSYVQKLRPALNQHFPGVTFSFLPADIVNQILNFGLPSPIDIRVFGAHGDLNRQYASQLLEKMKHIPGIVDAYIWQPSNYPEIFLDVNRTLAMQQGFTQKDVATNMLISLSGSAQTSPNFWLDHKNGVSYPIVTQVPQPTLNSIQALSNIPVTGMSMNHRYQILGSLLKMKREFTAAVVSHYNVQPVIDIYASIQNRDLGSVAHDINHTLNQLKSKVPKGSRVIVSGQISTQQSSFTILYGGLILSIILIYLLIVVNFQSWTDPFIILTGLPAAITGIVWMLFITKTTLSVPALTGTIMCMGIATANSILVVSFARQLMNEGQTAIAAALEAGASRLRPVMMTASAMILGMLPMALGLGAGGAQNAPLGRAVIGGLLFATVATLFFVPVTFSLIHGRRHTPILGEQ